MVKWIPSYFFDIPTYFITLPHFIIDEIDSSFDFRHDWKLIAFFAENSFQFTYPYILPYLSETYEYYGIQIGIEWKCMQVFYGYEPHPSLYLSKRYEKFQRCYPLFHDFGLPNVIKNLWTLLVPFLSKNGMQMCPLQKN